MLSLIRGKKFCEITLTVLTIFLSIQHYHLIKKHEIFSLNKLNSATLYEILIDGNKIKPTSQIYFENIFRILSLIGEASVYYLEVWHWMQTSECCSTNY